MLLTHFQPLKALSKGCKEIISSSGGNAGLAVAYSCRKLGVKCHVVVPSTTSQRMKERIKNEEAQVEVHGSVWNDSNERAIEIVNESPQERVIVHPFDDPIVWYVEMIF